MLAVYLGEVNEDKILEMSYVFFDDVIKELGYRLNYEAIVNYAGNSFFEKSWEVIMDNNPFYVNVDLAKQRSLKQMGGIFKGAKIETVSRSSPKTNDEADDLAALELYENTLKEKAGGNKDDAV